MASVCVADSYPIVRTGIRTVLSKSGEFQIESEVASFSELRALLEKQPAPQLVVLDFNMPGGGGVEAVKEIARANPQIPILVFSQQPEDQYAIRAIKAGARGYLCKECPAEELVAALKSISENQTYISERAKHLLNPAKLNSRKAHDSDHQALSDREFDVMLMIARGMPLKAIATHLSLSTKTVSTYRHRILTKMAMKTNADIVQYAIRHSLLSPQ